MNNNHNYIGYCRGEQAERDAQRQALRQANCSHFIDDGDLTHALCPALHTLPDNNITLAMTELSVLRGTQSNQLSWLRKWLLNGNHLITLDGVLDSKAWPETAALIAVLAGHNPKAQQAPAGRPAGLSEQALELSERAENLYNQKKLTSLQSARRLGIARSTYYRYLNLRKSCLQDNIDNDPAAMVLPSSRRKA